MPSERVSTSQPSPRHSMSRCTPVEHNVQIDEYNYEQYHTSNATHQY